MKPMIVAEKLEFLFNNGQDLSVTIKERIVDLCFNEYWKKDVTPNLYVAL